MENLKDKTEKELLIEASQMLKQMYQIHNSEELTGDTKDFYQNIKSLIDRVEQLYKIQ